MTFAEFVAFVMRVNLFPNADDGDLAKGLPILFDIIDKSDKNEHLTREDFIAWVKERVCKRVHRGQDADISSYSRDDCDDDDNDVLFKRYADLLRYRSKSMSNVLGLSVEENEVDSDRSAIADCNSH